MARVTRIDELTLAVLNGSDDDELLDYLADAAFSDLHADTLLILLPSGEKQWTCEVVRGRFREELLGTSVGVTEDAPAQETRVARILAAQNTAALDMLSWDQISRALTGAPLDPSPEQPPMASTFSADSTPLLFAPRLPHLLARVLEVGRDQVGLLLTVRFHAGTESPQDLAFGRDEVILADALASVLSFALNGATGRSDIEDNVATERDRIARDLHDLAIQELFAVGMQLESVTDEANATIPGFADSGPVAQSLKESIRGIERSIAEIRGIVQSLRNEQHELTLTQRVRHECAVSIAGLGFAPSLTFHSATEDIDRTSTEVTEDVVAVVRECLANAARHAQATAVAVTISMLRDGVDPVIHVNVSDNGRGIDPEVTRRSGLANMRARARRHSGWVDVLPLEQGTMISWRATDFDAG